MLKKIPQRMCIACKTHKDKKDLIRVVKAQDGSISLDFTKPSGALISFNTYLITASSFETNKLLISK